MHQCTAASRGWQVNSSSLSQLPDFREQFNGSKGHWLEQPEHSTIIDSVHYIEQYNNTVLQCVAQLMFADGVVDKSDAVNLTIQGIKIVLWNKCKKYFDYTCICTCMYTCILAYIHVYIYTCVYTYIHVHNCDLLREMGLNATNSYLYQHVAQRWLYIMQWPFCLQVTSIYTGRTRHHKIHQVWSNFNSKFLCFMCTSTYIHPVAWCRNCLTSRWCM